MDLSDLQAALNRSLVGSDHATPLAVDGISGPRTREAINILLARQGVAAWQNWNAKRRELAAMQIVCRNAGIETGAIDGLIGPQTRFAFESFDHVKATGKPPALFRDEPPPRPEPTQIKPVWPRQAECLRFYGPVGENQTKITMPFPLRIAWEPDKVIHSFPCHERVHDSMLRVYRRVLEHYGPERIRSLGLDLWGGCLNVRKMRGGSSWSMHSWGIAVDHDPDHNQLKMDHTQARFAQPEYVTWFDLWKEEDWVSLGRARDYDWMHVQAARL